MTDPKAAEALARLIRDHGAFNRMWTPETAAEAIIAARWTPPTPNAGGEGGGALREAASAVLCDYDESSLSRVRTVDQVGAMEHLRAALAAQPTAQAQGGAEKTLSAMFAWSGGNPVPNSIGRLVWDWATTIKAALAGKADTGELSHVANEWADMATSGLQWLKNIRDEISTPAEAIVSMEVNLAHCQETARTTSTPPIAAGGGAGAGLTKALADHFCDAGIADPLAQLLAEDSTKIAARASTASHPTWECAARRQTLPEPADCDWPMCGCDPAANKVIEALEEIGGPLTASPPQVEALREALEPRGCPMPGACSCPAPQSPNARAKIICEFMGWPEDGPAWTSAHKLAGSLSALPTAEALREEKPTSTRRHEAERWAFPTAEAKPGAGGAS